jgi:signal transduction histidine kinase
MTDSVEDLRKRQKELEIELEETKSLSQARSKLLEEHISELDGIYHVLDEKIKDLRKKDARIRGFQEELIRANKLSALGELASSIAHEIKNPLIAIQGFARRIESALDRAKIEQYAKYIEGEAERLSKVLTKLLDFSRMDEPKKEPHDPNGIVDDTILFMEHHLTRFKRVTLVVDKEENLPLVPVDKIHIQQALVNIMMNGAQAMPEGGALRIRTSRQDGRVIIAVVDEGAGIKDEDLGRIFEPFFTTKIRGEGTGLGLSLSKRLIEANGGTIEVESLPGKGSTFRLVLPAAEVAP